MVRKINTLYLDARINERFLYQLQVFVFNTMNYLLCRLDLLAYVQPEDEKQI